MSAEPPREPTGTFRSQEHWEPQPPRPPDERDAGCRCQGCGARYTIDVLVPDDIWERIKPTDKPEGGGLLCGKCIGERIERATPPNVTAWRLVDVDQRNTAEVALAAAQERITALERDLQEAEAHLSTTCSELLDVVKRYEEAAEQVAALSADTRRLREALQKLTNEIRGVFLNDAYESEMREAVGHTNYACVTLRVTEAEAALSAAPAPRQEP